MGYNEIQNDCNATARNLRIDHVAAGQIVDTKGVSGFLATSGIFVTELDRFARILWRKKSRSKLGLRDYPVRSKNHWHVATTFVMVDMSILSFRSKWGMPVMINDDALLMLRIIRHAENEMLFLLCSVMLN
jgi:hypothetical protein